MGTDMYFKASGLGWFVWIIAFVESIVVFTIGSELLTTACFGMLFELVPEAFKHIAQFFTRLFSDEEVSQSKGR